MPINTTGVSKNFLPMFTPSGNLASDMRKIEIAKSISFAWLKGQFYSNMKKAGQVSTASGKEYFMPVEIRGNSYGFFTYGTKGYWIAESLRLLGYNDDSLRELADASNGDLDNIIWVWRRHRTLNSNDFSYYANLLKQKISGVDSIEIEYELDRYKSTVYTTEASRIYVPKSTTGYAWGTACISNPSIYKWSLNESWSITPNIIHKDKEYVWGKIKLLSLGIDVTANYSTPIKNALVAMIAYSGDSFMSRTSATKIGERNYTVYSADYAGEYTIQETFISAIGKETFDASIKQTFIDDVSETNWKHYSTYYQEGMPYDISGTVVDRVPLTAAMSKISGRWRDASTYSRFFWELSGFNYSETDTDELNLIDNGEEFLFKEYSRMSAVMSVEEFLKLNIDDFTFYMGKYFTFDINYNNGTFLDDILEAAGELFNFLVGTLFDIFYAIPVLRQMMQLNTWILNTTFNSDLSDEEVFKITIQVAIIIYTAGAGAEAIEAGQASTASVAIASTAIALGASIQTAVTIAIVASIASSAYAIYQSIEKIDELDKARETEEQRSKQAILDEEKAKQKEKDDLQEQLQQRIQEGEQREHQNFLSNPLYIMDNEFKLGINSIDSEMNKQFNLI